MECSYSLPGILTSCVRIVFPHFLRYQATTTLKIAVIKSSYIQAAGLASNLRRGIRLLFPAFLRYKTTRTQKTLQETCMSGSRKHEPRHLPPFQVIFFRTLISCRFFSWDILLGQLPHQAQTHITSCLSYQCWLGTPAPAPSAASTCMQTRKLERNLELMEAKVEMQTWRPHLCGTAVIFPLFVISFVPFLKQQKKFKFSVYNYNAQTRFGFRGNAQITWPGVKQ